MADHGDLRDQVWGVLKALPRPVSHDAALDAAIAYLKPLNHSAADQFRAWFDKHGAAVLENLNRG